MVEARQRGAKARWSWHAARYGSTGMGNLRRFCLRGKQGRRQGILVRAGFLLEIFRIQSFARVGTKLSQSIDATYEVASAGADASDGGFVAALGAAELFANLGEFTLE